MKGEKKMTTRVEWTNKIIVVRIGEIIKEIRRHRETVARKIARRRETLGTIARDR